MLFFLIAATAPNVPVRRIPSTTIKGQPLFFLHVSMFIRSHINLLHMVLHYRISRFYTFDINLDKKFGS